MKKTEIIITVLLLLAFALAINGVMFGNTLAILLSGAFIIYNIYLGIKYMKAAVPAEQKALILASYTIGTLLVTLGSLYIVMLWPAARYMLYIAVASMSIISLGTLGINMSDKSGAARPLLLRNALYMLWLVLLMVTPSSKIMDYRYGDSPFYPEYVNIRKALDADPENDSLISEKKLALEKLRHTRRNNEKVEEAESNKFSR